MAMETNEPARGVGQSTQVASTRHIPPGFKPYASLAVQDDGECVVGAVADQDGLHQQPVVGLASGKNRVVAWARHLDGLEDAYQARATHCVLGDDALYVLLQTDTHSQHALSQTLLSVAKLDLDGEVLQTQPIHVPDAAKKSYSAYVEDVPGYFRWENSRLRIQGYYFLTSDPHVHRTFVLDIGPDIQS